MTSLAPFSDRALRALAGLVSAPRSDLPPAGLPVSLLTELMEHIRCDAVTVEGFDSTRELTWLQQSVPDDGSGYDPSISLAHWQNYWDCEPCSYPDRTGDLRRVIKIADFYSARQWHSTGMYREVYRPQGIEHELMVCLPLGPGVPAEPGRTLRMFFFRGPGRDFSESDRAVATLLRPHLFQAYADAERRRSLPALTPRHWQLLGLLAAGHTNAQIARRLEVSEGTVRTHLENIYSRLRVSSRTAAVTRVFANWDAPSIQPHT